ncbi:MAG: D-ornithine 4,5-aminomutase subunit OraS [Sedimenticola sp.]
MMIKERAENHPLHNEALDDGELHEEFWILINQVADPLMEGARTHTTPAIEHSLLLRMGFDCDESTQLVRRMEALNLLGYGAAHLVLKLARLKGLRVREAGMALLGNRYWDELV